MQIVVKKWGNSAAIRIPARVMAAAGLRLDDAVQVREKKGRIILEPVRSGKISLQALVDGITPDNRHESCEFGEPVGNEVW